MSWPAPTGEPIRPGTGGPGAPPSAYPAGGPSAPAPMPPQFPTAPPTAAPNPSGYPGHGADTAGGAAPNAAPGGIQTLATAPITPPTLAPLSERSGQPVRPWTIWVSAALMFGGAITVTVGLLMAMWTMASPWQRVEPEGWTKVDRFNEATWLTAWFPSEPATGWRVFFAIACCALTVLVAATASVIGYYAFAGYRWTRIGALVALGVSLLSLLLNPVAMVSIGFVALGAGPLWLPASTRYFARWYLVRHPQVAYTEPVENVFYGPLPRYR